MRVFLFKVVGWSVLISVPILIPFCMVIIYSPTYFSDLHNKVMKHPIEIGVEKTPKQRSNQIHLNEETYLIGVLAGEVPASFEMEALKAQAIAARSYYEYRTKIEGEQLTASELTSQKYISIEEMKQKWGVDFKKNYARIQTAVRQTESMHLKYNEQPVLAAFFSSSNGRTEEAGNVWGKSMKYLVSVSSPWEAQLNRQRTATITYNWEKLSRILDIPIHDLRFYLSIIEKTSGNRAKTIQLSMTKKIDATIFRKKLSLDSTAIRITKRQDECVIETIGYGHGVGMSQWGAEALARKGWNAEEIIKHYYPGTKIVTENEKKTYILTSSRSN